MEPLMDPYFTEPRRKQRDRGQIPRVTPDLVEWLKETFKPRCIQPGQSEIDAHRYAAKVELAETIIKMAQNEDRVDYSYEVGP